MSRFGKILSSGDRVKSGDSCNDPCKLFNNFAKREVLDHEYSILYLSSLTGSEMEESDRAFFVSGDDLDFLQEGFGIEL